jgi:hypothetical protein
MTQPAATSTVVARIDDVIAATGGACLCGCAQPMGASPSMYWATEACQHRWHRVSVGASVPAGGVDPVAVAAAVVALAHELVLRLNAEARRRQAGTGAGQ